MTRLLLSIGILMAALVGIPAAGAASPALTRAEMLTIVFHQHPELQTRVRARRARMSRLPLFRDVPIAAPEAPYVEVAFEENLLTGYPDRTFRPDEGVTVERAIAFLLSAYSQPVEQAEGEEWYAPSIRKALERNLIPYPRGMRVGEIITREQFSHIVQRMEVLRSENLSAYVSPTESVGQAAVFGATVAGEGLPVERPLNVARASEDSRELQSFRSEKEFAISIPSLGIRDMTVTHPHDASSQAGLLSVLQDGVGHLFSEPAQGGKIMIYGHSSGYAWDVSPYTKAFRQVQKLRPGERVYVTVRGQLFAYVVTGQQVISPNDTRPFTGDGEELILYTCWPVGSNTSRLIVRAVPMETVAVR